MVTGISLYTLVGSFVVLMEVALVPECHVASRERAGIRLLLRVAQNMGEKLADTHDNLATIAIVIALEKAGALLALGLDELVNCEL